MITDEIVYTETRVWKLDHATGGAKRNSHMGKGHRMGASVHFGHLSSCKKLPWMEVVEEDRHQHLSEVSSLEYPYVSL